MSVQATRFKNAIAITIGKKSKAVLDKSVKEYTKKFHNFMPVLKERLVKQFLSKPWSKSRNTSPFPRRKTGQLIKSLSYVVRKTNDRLASETKLTKRHVQFTVKQLWDESQTQMSKEMHGTTSYGELLNKSKRYKQYQYRVLLSDMAKQFIEREVRRFA